MVTGRGLPVDRGVTSMVSGGMNLALNSADSLMVLKVWDWRRLFFMRCQPISKGDVSLSAVRLMDFEGRR